MHAQRSASQSDIHLPQISKVSSANSGGVGRGSISARSPTRSRIPNQSRPLSGGSLFLPRTRPGSAPWMAATPITSYSKNIASDSHTLSAKELVGEGKRRHNELNLKPSFANSSGSHDAVAGNSARCSTAPLQSPHRQVRSACVVSCCCAFAAFQRHEALLRWLFCFAHRNCDKLCEKLDCNAAGPTQTVRKQQHFQCAINRQNHEYLKDAQDPRTDRSFLCAS